ncbi:MBL fold metallo-hydrolase [Melioribacteraceae bacterium 4301-Me]|uniref:MBL fold metallo-hydrolase n=1 Tax=Pyranulibacter aquaticus TaxID=3163344 RepID=UPI003598EEF8
MIQFLPLGGADEIGASCYYLNIGGTGIILDSGVHPRKKGFESLPSFELIENLPVDFVFISHAHQDHIGALPFLVKKFPHLIIYTTRQTKEIAELTLHNASNILMEEMDTTENFIPYTHEEIDFLIDSIRTVEYNLPLEISGIRHNSTNKIKVEFYDAGHILGSAGILIIYEDIKIFYTGDINLSKQKIMDGADIPSTAVNILLTESTYGATDSSLLSNWINEQKRFALEANKILNKGGSILIPVFALGKTQELLATIHSLISKGSLTETFIYTGGLGKQISKIYDRNKFIVKRQNKNFEFSDVEQIDLYDINDVNFFNKKPGIVLASSGMMLKKTKSYELMRHWINQKDFAVFIVGYVDSETPAYQILKSNVGDKILLEQEEYIVNCSVERFYFPSHSKREELLEITKNLNPEIIVLLHGEEEAKNWLGNKMLTLKEKIKVYSAEKGRVINLL